MKREVTLDFSVRMTRSSPMSTSSRKTRDADADADVSSDSMSLSVSAPIAFATLRGGNAQTDAMKTFEKWNGASRSLSVEQRAVVKIQNAIRRFIRKRRDGRDRDAAARVMREVRGRAVKCALLTLAWFATGLGLALFNKQILGQKRGGFPAPLLLTAIQFAMQFLFAKTAMRMGVIEQAERKNGRREPVPNDVYWKSLAPVGITMGLDIALSNLSLVFVTVSAYTVAKTSTIVFTLLLAFMFRFERPTWFLGTIVTMVTVGQIMSVEGDSQFNLTGFVIVIIAALMSALRWTLAQRVMHRDPNAPGDHATGIKSSHLVDHPVVFVYLLMPVMCVTVLIFSCVKEKWWNTLPHSKWMESPIEVFVELFIFSIGALAAFCLTLAEFELLNETSALTIMMIGVVKDILAIALGVILFGDKFGTENFAGLALCLAGVVGYNKFKFDMMKRTAMLRMDAPSEEDSVPLVEMSSATSDGLPEKRRAHA
jgi:solute carrier family 35 protein C2